MDYRIVYEKLIWLLCEDGIICTKTPMAGLVPKRELYFWWVCNSASGMWVCLRMPNKDANSKITRKTKIALLKKLTWLHEATIHLITTFDKVLGSLIIRKNSIGQSDGWWWFSATSTQCPAPALHSARVVSVADSHSAPAAPIENPKQSSDNLLSSSWWTLGINFSSSINTWTFMSAGCIHSLRHPTLSWAYYCVIIILPTKTHRAEMVSISFAVPHYTLYFAVNKQM